jgi:hypothetical protein
MRNAYEILVGNSKGKRPLERPKWDNDTKTYLRETVHGLNWLTIWPNNGNMKMKI